MTHKTQPGTLPHRVVTWLKAQAKATGNLSGEYSSVEICAALDFDPENFADLMRYCRDQGTLHSRKQPGSRILFWRLGDGQPDPGLGWRKSSEVVTHDASIDLIPEGKLPDFRALRWMDHLLVTGVEVRDGVAIFKPEQVMQLKAHTDWWRAPA